LQGLVKDNFLKFIREAYIWSDPTTREKLLKDLSEAGYDAEKLDSMKNLIDARDSDV